MKADDWESRLAFIRLEFPPRQREVAHRLAVVLAPIVGSNITRLRPDLGLQEVIGASGGDSLDTVECVMAIESEFRFGIADEFAASASRKTFREMVEHIVAQNPGAV